MAEGYLDALARLDETAWRLERKWGVGRLEEAAPPDLRERFARQREKLEAAIAADNAPDIVAQAEALARGWNALDKAAEAAGATPPKPDYTDIQMGDKAYRIVRYTRDTYLDFLQGKNVEVVSLETLLAVYEYQHKKVVNPFEKKPVTTAEYPAGYFKRGDDLHDF